LNDDAQYKLLKLLAERPEAPQRELARELGISLGKVNYCLQALIQKGYVKAGNFKKSGNKAAYLYLLTPRGVKAKAQISARYLERKVAEYEALKAEIAALRADIEHKDPGPNAR